MGLVVAGSFEHRATERINQRALHGMQGATDDHYRETGDRNSSAHVMDPFLEVCKVAMNLNKDWNSGCFSAT